MLTMHEVPTTSRAEHLQQRTSPFELASARARLPESIFNATT